MLHLSCRSILCLLPLGIAFPTQAQSSESVKARPVSRRLDDSTYAAHYRRQRLLLDAISHNQPLSWIAPGGELVARNHRVAAPTADIRPKYVFSAYLKSQFVVVGQPRWAFTIDPAFSVRMRRGGDTRGSYPIRTPSYLVGGNLYFRTLMRATPPETDPADPTPNCPPSLDAYDMHYHYLRVGFTHHSNGQQDSAFIGGAPNERTGNFANNAVEAAYVMGLRNTGGTWAVAPYTSYGLTRLAETTQQGRYLFRRAGVRITREVFSTWRRVLGQRAQPGDQSNNELARRNKSRLYTELNVSFGLSRLDSLPQAERGMARRVNAEATAVWIPRFAHQTGIFVTVGYYGEDPYNIWYLHRYPFVRAGIATAAFRNVTELLR